ncbi:MAG TPA: PQQ-binding-like beta-propeller repeat protein, partial [Candidatus Hydrogenedentes bacterium]|nr:PQQ-binding-like beta-propeller repeat protein [Candidatus Hydrogenedentota bacterium]
MPRTKPRKRRFTANEIGRHASVAVVIVSGVFCLVVATLLIANFVQIQAFNPLDNPEMLKLRAQWAAAPEADEKLLQEIRAMDLLARKAYFTSQTHLKTGGYLLTGGVVVLLVAIRLAARFGPKLPVPDPGAPSASYWTSRAHARELLAFIGLAVALVALVSAYFTRLDIPPVDTSPAAASREPIPVQPAETRPPIPWETIQRNWPSFRGPGGYGVAFHTTAPVDWDLASGKNIKWKTDIPLPGANSPVVWDNRVFLSGADANMREVYCFDADGGQMLWKHVVERMPGAPDKPPKVGEETGFAAPTMAAHGNRVFAIFANGDLVCLDFDGKKQWGKSLGLPDNHYGYSSSLLACENLLFVQYDQKKGGKLYAFDVLDGHEKWSVNRTALSWSSPACVPTPSGLQLVVNSAKDVDAYDPLSGTRLWNVPCLDGEVAPSPAYGGGMFFVANDMATATAIRFVPGDPPKPEIAWQWDESLPDVASPVCTDRHFYLATSRAEIVCLDAATGKEQWLQEFDEGFYASPILVGDRIYALDM